MSGRDGEELGNKEELNEYDQLCNSQLLQMLGLICLSSKLTGELGYQYDINDDLQCLIGDDNMKYDQHLELRIANSHMISCAA